MHRPCLYQFGFSTMKVVAVIAVILCAIVALGLAQRRHYCGRRLDRKLYDLCGGIYNKRSGAMSLDLADARGLEVQDSFLDQAALYEGGVRQRRGIVEECCHRGCTDWELSFYCKNR